MTNEERNRQDISMIVGAVQAEVKIFTSQQKDFQATIFKLHGDLKKEVTERIDNTLAAIPCSERAERLAAVEATSKTNHTIVHQLSGIVQDHEQTLAPIRQEREEKEQTATAQKEDRRGIRIEVKSALYIAGIMGLFELVKKFWPF